MSTTYSKINPKFPIWSKDGNRVFFIWGVDQFKSKKYAKGIDDLGWRLYCTDYTTREKFITLFGSNAVRDQEFNNLRSIFSTNADSEIGPVHLEEVMIAGQQNPVWNIVDAEIVAEPVTKK